MKNLTFDEVLERKKLRVVAVADAVVVVNIQMNKLFKKNYEMTLPNHDPMLGWKISGCYRIQQKYNPKPDISNLQMELH